MAEEIEDSYYTIAEASEGIYKEKGSKFIAYAYPVSNEDEIKLAISALKKSHHSARHHCYAYRLGYDMSVFRANDDGEPSNTAGKPILGQIQSKELTNILIVVVRYFGGVKLGVGGLITAYRASALDAIENANVVKRLAEDVIQVQFEYPFMNTVMKVIKDYNLEAFDQIFELDCSLKVNVRKSLTQTILEKFEDIERSKVNLV